MEASRMKPLQDAARSREDDAVNRFVSCQRELQRHETRLIELRAYVTDYSKVKGEVQVGTLLRIRREFVDRLREIVKMEEQAVVQARLACDAERAHWLAAHRSTEMLDKLTAQYRTQEAKVETRRDQRETDDVATQVWRNVHGLNV